MDKTAKFLNEITRPIVTIICISGLTAGFFLKLISGEVYTTIVTAIIFYWFKQDDSEAKRGELATKTATEVVAQTVERRSNDRSQPAAVARNTRNRRPT